MLSLIMKRMMNFFMYKSHILLVTINQIVHHNQKQEYLKYQNIKLPLQMQQQANDNYKYIYIFFFYKLYHI